jgi:hypothetical protein
MPDVGTGLALLGPSTLVAQKILGPTADYVGEGLQSWTERRVENVQRIFRHAERMLGPEQLERPGAVPPRVLRGILEEGSFQDDELGAEYLGGVLASSRTETPRDDRAATLIALVGRLSTYGLRLHYAMYAGARPALIGTETNLGNEIERATGAIFFMPFETFVRSMDFSEAEDESIDGILSHAFNALLREQLIDKLHSFGGADHLRKSHGNRAFTSGGLVYVLSPLGIELFCSAHGHRGSPLRDFTDPNIEFELEQRVDITPAPNALQDIPVAESPPDS